MSGLRKMKEGWLENYKYLISEYSEKNSDLPIIEFWKRRIRELEVELGVVGPV